MANLKTNFKDDILNVNVNERRRYNVIQNEDGTVSFEDVTGYSQQGDYFGAGYLNQTNQEVNNRLEKNSVIKELAAIRALTQNGYVPDALLVKGMDKQLSGVSLIVDPDSGKLSGYTTEIGGADAVFPFRGEDLQYTIYDSSMLGFEKSLPSAANMGGQGNVGSYSISVTQSAIAMSLIGNAWYSSGIMYAKSPQYNSADWELLNVFVTSRTHYINSSVGTLADETFKMELLDANNSILKSVNLNSNNSLYTVNLKDAGISRDTNFYIRFCITAENCGPANGDNAGYGSRSLSLNISKLYLS